MWRLHMHPLPRESLQAVTAQLTPWADGKEVRLGKQIPLIILSQAHGF